MSFNKRTWVDRSSEYPNRRKLIDDAGTEKTYTVERYEGEISAEGDDWSAANMNDLEQRIADSIDGTASSLAIAEDGTNSANAYSVGSFLSHKGVLYEVVAPISKGDKLDTVTNIKQVTVGQMLEHLVANQKSFVFAYDAATSRYGYTIDGTFHPFRNPTGNAGSADVLAGKTFSSAGLDDATGTMPNNGTNKNAVSVGGGSGSLYAYMPYGYYDNYNNSGNAWINITNDQAKTLANNAGVGYNSGYTNGHQTFKSSGTLWAVAASRGMNVSNTSQNCFQSSITITVQKQSNITVSYSCIDTTSKINDVINGQMGVIINGTDRTYGWNNRSSYSYSGTIPANGTVTFYVRCGTNDGLRMGMNYSLTVN